ncbi:MAG: DUF349 domain-containing protein [Vicinamibacteria bacterium]
MDLLERFRRQTPRWESPDPAVRAEGVRAEVRAEEQALLARIASEDPDPRVRKAAVQKLAGTAALVAAARDDDEGVRETAAEALLGRALGSAEADALEALAGLPEPRHLMAVARTAALGGVRQAALARIVEPRSLALLARTAEDAAVRAEALRRVEDPALIAEVAAKSEHKGTAVAAVERVLDVERLRSIAARASHKGASRRAQAKLDVLFPPAVPVAPEPPSSPEVGEAVAPEPAPAASEAAPPPAPEPEIPVAESQARPQPVPVSDPAAEEAARDAASKREADARARRDQVARAEALSVRIEALGKVEGLTLRDAEACLREARTALASPLPAKVEHRLKAARAALFARAQELREADEWSRWANAAIQEELCQRLEALAGQEDLEEVAKQIREADVRWAVAKLAPREQADGLRHRFQAAREPLKLKLDAYFAKKAEQQAQRLKEKQALSERAEALAESADWLKVAEEIKGLQARWKEIGPAAPRDERLAWKRFHASCDRFFTRRHEDLRKRKGEWAQHLSQKEALCAKAEALVDSTEWESTAGEVRRLQAEWKEIGPVRRNQSEATWARFRKACDAFFERYKRREEIEAGSRRGEREALCGELEALAPEGSVAPDDLAQRVLDLMVRARQAPPLPVAIEEELTRRLVTGRNRLIELHPERFRGTELDPEANRARREKLCTRVEALAEAHAAAGTPADLSGTDLARRLKEALASNTIGGKEEAESRQRAERAEVESAQAAWKRLGPVPGEIGTALEARFSAACTRFLGSQRGSSRGRAR